MGTELKQGQIISGRLFSEPMRVETVSNTTDGAWRVGLVGTQTEKFCSVSMSAADLAELKILQSTRSFQGEGHLLRLGIQAYSLGIAFEFDPYFGLSVSRVDPLPHQLEAVYDFMLKLPRARFLLADDAGAGKTIMAGLLLREELERQQALSLQAVERISSVLVLPHPEREKPELRTHQDPARFSWREVTQVAHYTLPTETLNKAN